MAFWKCYYHIVWATKYRVPMIKMAYKSIIYAELHRIAREKEIQIHAVNAVSDHLHIAVSIPPKMAVTDAISHFKGATSRIISREFDPDEPLSWQKSYGVLTFGQKVLPFVLEYIQNQEQHHSENTTQEYLERIDIDV